MMAVLKILLGVLATVLVGVLSIIFDILPGSALTAETELQRHVDQKLAASDYPWAQVTIDGQKAVISGSAPSHEDFDNALAAIRGSAWHGGFIVGGVTAVDTAGVRDAERLPIADPFIWIVEYQTGALVFSGQAPSDNARKEIFKRAAEAFPDAEISGALDLAGGAPPESDWLAAAAISLHALARLEAGAIEANGAQFVLTGAANSAERADVLRRFMSTLPQGMTGKADIAVVLPAPVSVDAPAVADNPAVTESEFSTPAPDIAAAPFTEQAFTDACRTRLRGKISERRIGFRTGSAFLADASRDYLLELAGEMNECPQFSFEISGHTDSTGGQTRNRQLSERRANAVLTFLVESGNVPPRRLTARGAGEAEPLVSNATAEGRRRNRRIDMDLIFDPQ